MVFFYIKNMMMYIVSVMMITVLFLTLIVVIKFSLSLRKNVMHNMDEFEIGYVIGCYKTQVQRLHENPFIFGQLCLQGQ